MTWAKYAIDWFNKVKKPQALIIVAFIYVLGGMAHEILKHQLNNKDIGGAGGLLGVEENEFKKAFYIAISDPSLDELKKLASEQDKLCRWKYSVYCYYWIWINHHNLKQTLVDLRLKGELYEFNTDSFMKDAKRRLVWAILEEEEYLILQSTTGKYDGSSRILLRSFEEVQILERKEEIGKRLGYWYLVEYEGIIGLIRGTKLITYPRL